MGNPLHSHRVSRRQALALTVMGMSMLPLTSCALSAAQPRKPEGTITIGYVPIACTAPLILADAQGYFADHNVTVSLRKYAGWADLWSAYATGEIHVAHMLAPMPLAINAGVTNAARPTELVFTQNTNGQAIILANTHRNVVTTAADLRGMTIGIPFEFSVHSLLLRDYLTAHGLDPDRDLELRLLRPADMVAQLQIGTIDGFIGPEPFIQRAITAGSGYVFIFTHELWPNHPCCAIAMATDWRQSHPAEAIAITQALAAGAQAAGNHDHAANTAHILGSEQYLNQPEKLFIPALQEPDRINFGTPTDPAAIIWMTTQIARWRLGNNALDWDDATILRIATNTVGDSYNTTINPITVNGQPFDPLIPTATYTAHP